MSLKLSFSISFVKKIVSKFEITYLSVTLHLVVVVLFLFTDLTDMFLLPPIIGRH
jgi:hypothetical protein